MDNQKTELVNKKEGVAKNWIVINARSQTGIKCKCSYWRTDHGNVETVTIWETLAMPEETGSGKLIDPNEKSSCDEKNKAV